MDQKIAKDPWDGKEEAVRGKNLAYGQIRTTDLFITNEVLVFD